MEPKNEPNMYDGITLGTLHPTLKWGAVAEESSPHAYVNEDGDHEPHGDRIRITVLTTSDHEKLFRNHDPRRYVFAWDRDKEPDPAKYLPLVEDTPRGQEVHHTRISQFAAKVSQMLVEQEQAYLPMSVKLIVIVEFVSPLAQTNDRDHVGWQIGLFAQDFWNGRPTV